MSNMNSSCLMSDFIFKLKGCADRHVPVRKLTAKEISLKSKPWIDSNLSKMIRIKNNLFRRKKHQPGNKSVGDLYKKFRNRVNRGMKKAKKDYYVNYFNENNKIIRKIWKGIR